MLHSLTKESEPTAQKAGWCPEVTKLLSSRVKGTLAVWSQHIHSVICEQSEAERPVAPGPLASEERRQSVEHPFSFGKLQ